MIFSSLLYPSFPLPHHWAHALLVTSNPKPNPTPTTPLSPPSPPLPARRTRCRCRRRGPSLDPNAESVRGARFKFRDEAGGEDFRQGSRRRWWSDDSPDDEFEEEFDPVDDDEDDVDKSEELWDKIWIFKVFRSYGYLLPAIITSMLLATGPKAFLMALALAFLMALALPLGQSAISLALEKLWGHEELRARSRTMRKPFSRSSTDFRKQGQDESSDEYKRRAIYQSWVAADTGLNDDKARDSERSSFGGWDDLDQPKRRGRRRPPKVDRSTLSTEVKIGKLSKKGRYRDAPLILRVLIAVFPFLGSWTRIL